VLANVCLMTKVEAQPKLAAFHIEGTGTTPKHSNLLFWGGGLMNVRNLCLFLQRDSGLLSA
jgi:hypothetical protein